jgi:hypothetical protein
MTAPDALAAALAAVKDMARQVMACKTRDEAAKIHADALRARMLDIMREIGSRTMDVTDADDGAALGTVSLTGGGPTVVVSDPDKLMAWVEDNRPDELVPTKVIRGSFLKALMEAVKTRGAPVDADGNPIPGLDITMREPHLTATPTHVAYARARERLAADQR